MVTYFCMRHNKYITTKYFCLEKASLLNKNMYQSGFAEMFGNVTVQYYFMFTNTPTILTH